jgi:hypothetical protein
MRRHRPDRTSGSVLRSGLSVDGRTLHHYRQAHEISGRATSGATDEKTSTEGLRQAMPHYRVLFEELLNDVKPGGEHPVRVSAIALVWASLAR